MSSEAAGATFFGHPRGLSTLFFTEMWERFSYYGMRALLILYLTDAVRGGFGLDTPTAAAIYGLYVFGVYALALPGGWIADRLVGQRVAVLYGGVIIAAGHFSMAIPSTATFYLGLCLIVVGTGLLKPNVSAIVGDLYPEGGARRDAGFSVFYMGINIGAVLGPTICAFLGEGYNWHLGFGAAGVGMTFGVIQYVAGKKHLLGCGELPEAARPQEVHAASVRQFLSGVGMVVALTVAIFLLSASGLIVLTLVGFAQVTGVLITVVSIAYFAGVLAFVCRDLTERKRVFAIFLLFIGAAMFWSGFEQAGSSLNLFARDFTNRMVLGWEMPASMLQNINPTFIILLAPVVGGVWVRLGSRNPSIPIKFGLGLVLLGVGFLVLAWGSQFIGEGQVSPMWLVVTYFFHTVGELCLSPVGLSSTTKLSPQRLQGQMMGVWFMGTALGNLIAGLAAGYIDTLPVAELFSTVAMIVIATGALFFMFAIPIRKLTVGVS
ncbi:MAG TPA: peptide MFS transporter [Acidobacteriota bacterium]|nr:peptide MFS transporter [Acidobacteriota bacterium]